MCICKIVSQPPTCPCSPCGAQSPLGAQGDPNVSSTAPVKWPEHSSHVDLRPKVCGSCFGVGEQTQEFGVSARFGVRALCRHHTSPGPLTTFAGWLSEPRAVSPTASPGEGQAPRSCPCQERVCAQYLGNIRWALCATHRSLWAWQRREDSSLGASSSWDLIRAGF